MNSTVFKQLPLVGRQEVIALRKYLEDLLSNSSLFLIDAIEGDELHIIRDISGDYKFSVKFQSFDPNQRKIIYELLYNPMSKSSMNDSRIETTLEGVQNYLNAWINLVKKLHEASEQYYNPFGEFHEEQFNNFFASNDPDKDSQPFDISRQHLIYNCLKQIQNKITDSDLIDDEKNVLLKEIDDIQTGIPNTSKNQLLKRISNLGRKVYRYRTKLFYDILDVFKKEAIKKAGYTIWKAIPENLKTVDGWIEMLPGN
jgi:hypothetical protein